MKATITVTVVGTLLTLLSVIPTVQASFTDATSNDGNTFTTRQPIRVTTYQINENVFTGTTYDLHLNHDLSSDYFVIMRGGACNSNISSSGGYPSSDYARVVGGHHGNFGTATNASILQLHRQTTDGP